MFPAWTPLYGNPFAPKTPYRISHTNPAEADQNSRLIEFPLFALGPRGLRIPLGSGFFTRLIPSAFLDVALKYALRRGTNPVISFHPWETDSELRGGQFSYKGFVTFYRKDRFPSTIEHILKNYKVSTFRDALE